MKRFFPILFLMPALCLGFACARGVKPALPMAQAENKPPGVPTPGPSAAPAGAQEEVESFYEAPASEEVAAGAAEPEEEEPVIGSEVEEEIQRSVREEVPKFDIPIVMNAEVEKWLNYFQTRGRKYYAAWLSRSEKYIPMMKRILRENGLPEDLIYLAMIESGFKPYAYSRAKASGPWQFIRGTGRIYGLRVDFWFDERRDPEKSTLAAAQHLKDLYDQFNSWYLAAAGYNAGAGKIERAIRKYSTEDFWEMSTKHRRYLRPETKNYVPKMIAAALIAKSPERYGFADTQYEEPMQYDKVAVPEPTELSKIASALGMELSEVYDLNPELLRGITPPNMPDYELKLPKGSREKFLAAYPSIRRESAVVVRRHDVRRGETLASIARKYGKNLEAIRTFNNLKRQKVRRGQQLAIPFYETATRTASRGASPETVAEAFSEEKVPAQRGKKSVYRVRDGDTLWSISRRFNVSVSAIRRWNNLEPGDSIRPKQKLKLFARADPGFIGPAPSAPPETSPPTGGWASYEVRAGDTLWDIAKRFGVTVSDLSKWNELSGADLRVGQTLKIRAPGT